MSMFRLVRRLSAVIALALMSAAGTAAPQAAESYRLSGPVTHGNLALYFLHGASRPGPVPLTLQEALRQRTVEMRETGSVNELQVINTGREAVYVQSGDIVKGGRQDRVLLVSMVLPPRSGVVPIAVFCVEAGRWTGRGGESAAQFESAEAMLPSRQAKIEMRVTADAVATRQQRVWDSVGSITGGLSANVGAPVASPRSETSLQLALENDQLGRKLAEFVAGLEASGQTEDDILGYVAVINGRLNGAEIYPSNGLFRKMWPRLLRASATEAIKDMDGERRPLPTADEVMGFLDTAHATVPDTRPALSDDTRTGAAKPARVLRSEKAMIYEYAPPATAREDAWVNRSYLAR